MKSGDGTYVLGTIKVTFTPTSYGVSTSYDVLEVLDYSGDFDYFSPEETLDTVISFDNMAFEFYSDPQLMSSSTTHTETSLEEGKTLVIDLSYDPRTGILKSALIKSVDSSGATIGYSKYTLKSTNVSPGSLSAGEEGAQAATQANSAVSEGDWAIYKVTFYITRYEGDYIRGSISFKVVFHQGPYGVEYEFTDIQIESVDSNKPDQLNESTVNSFIQSIDYYTPMHIDPAELPADGVVEGSETYVDYRGEYFTDTGVLKSSSIELGSNEGEGQINVQIIQSSIASTESGGVPETGEVPGTGDAGTQATPTIKEGDWAVYRVTFDLSDNEGNYARGSATFKVVFHEYSYGIDYEFTDVKVESVDSNTGEGSESDIRELITAVEYIAPIHVDPANLPPGGVLEQSTDYVDYRAEYDSDLGVLRSITVTPKSEGSGHVTVELIDTSIAGLAPVAGGGSVLGGLGGMTTIIIIVVIVAVVAVVAVIVLKKRSKKSQYTYGQPQYGPPTPPTPPPPPPQ